jgi:signal peptidase I
VKTLDDRFDALRDELELTLRPNAPGIPESRSAVGRVVLSVALVVLLGAGATALTRRTGHLSPAVSTSNWFEQKSHSMEPTLGQFDKLQVGYNFTTLSRSDLVVAQVPDALSAKPMILRVVGLPGESVTLVEGGSITIAGTQLKEDYLNLQTKPIESSVGARAVRLEADEYFLAGDNRANPTIVASAVVKRTEILALAERGCSVFMNPDATAPQLAAVRNIFETEPAVKSFRYVDKDEALDELRHLFGEMGDYSFAGDGQGPPTSFRAVMNREIDSGGFEERAKIQPGISIVRCGLPIVEAHYRPLTERPTPTDVNGAFVTAAPATMAAPSSETTTTG